MTVQLTPTPARSDVPARRAAARPERPFRRHGLLLAAGAAAWAVAIAVGGVNREEADAVAQLMSVLGSGTFQLGLLALLRVLWRTRALGTGRVARAALRIEAVLVTLAIGSTVADGLGVADLSQLGWLLLDLNWPLSMLGMCLIGIRIAVAGRWTGLSRWWPMVAESWAVVVIPTMIVFGPAVATPVAAGHLLLGYTVLGLLVAGKQHPEV